MSVAIVRIAIKDGQVTFVGATSDISVVLIDYSLPMYRVLLPNEVVRITSDEALVADYDSEIGIVEPEFCEHCGQVGSVRYARNPFDTEYPDGRSLPYSNWCELCYKKAADEI